MKTFPRLSGADVDNSTTDQAADALPVEGALALALAGGARQRPLDLLAPEVTAGATPDEVIQLIDDLRPTFRSTQVRRGRRTFQVVTSRQ